MSLTIDNGEFFLATIRDEQTLHAVRDDAIDQLRDADGLDPETDDVSIERVLVDGDEWTIEALRWDRIALELLNGGGA